MPEPARGSMPPPSMASSGESTRAEPAASSVEERTPPLVQIQELLSSGRQVLLSLTAHDEGTRGALAAHVDRLLSLRASALADGPSLVRRIDARRADEGELIDAIVRALGVPVDSMRVAQVAERIRERLERGNVSLVITLSEPAATAASWSYSVLRDVANALAGDGRTMPALARVVIVGPPTCPVLSALGIARVDVAALLELSETWAWIEAVARRAGRSLAGGQVGLPALEDALLRARAAVPEVSAIVEPSGILRPDLDADGASPWGLLAQATGALEQGELERADQAVALAEGRTDDPEARRDIGRRWAELLEPRPPRERLELSRRAATRALAAADAEEAVRLARPAARAAELAQVRDGEPALLLELQGRALVAKGDVVMARAVLDRARQSAIVGQLPPPALASISV
ncbi:MAG: hypothetical protein K1X94_34575, partial [Sandaracinaceae bacterium]|nr:hypothetical protein [Sandaracinaceae bacterium]